MDTHLYTSPKCSADLDMHPDVSQSPVAFVVVVLVVVVFIVVVFVAIVIVFFAVVFHKSRI